MRSCVREGFLCLVVLVLASPAIAADTLIYSNANYAGYTFQPGYSNEIYDYGSSNGGLISKITFRYQSNSTVGNLYIRFFRSINTQYHDIGYFVDLIHIRNLPATGSSSQNYTYVLPEDERFELPAGQFGYSFECFSSSMWLALASGGAGNADDLWYYDDLWEDWYSFGFQNSHAGIYTKIYTGPRIEEITCDIAGYKFNDTNSNGFWDEGEFSIPRWEFYVDINGDNSYQVSEPNVLTDPNGMYFFENLSAPATYRIREIMPSGWTQTLPGAGSDNEYVIAAEPNRLYSGFDFGNTDQFIPSDIKLYGYIETEDGEPIEGARVEFFNGLAAVGGPDYTDAQGYYEVMVSAPFTGAAVVTKTGWSQNTGSRWHDNRMTDYQQDFEMLYLYDGGDGSEANPFQIRTAEQLLMIDHQNSHFGDHFVLTNDIDLAGTMYSGPVIASYYSGVFHGTFDGAGFSVLNLSSHSGLFGNIQNAVIKNLGVENVEIVGGGSVGALCHSNQGGTIDRCFTTGNINALFDAGGLCGWVHKEYLRDTVAIPGAPPVIINTPVIKNCYSTVNVTLDIPPDMFPEYTFGAAGGLCGYAESAELTNNYACGTVSASCGYSVFGTLGISDSGGLVGYLKNCNVANNYSTTYLVEREYNNPGGFCAKIINSNLTGNFWDIQASGQLTSAGDAGVVGLETALMQVLQTYLDAGWDFENAWRICDGMNYPHLQWEPVIAGDIACPDGVELNDLLTLADEWLLQKQSADIAPEGGDGRVDLLDWAMLADVWMTSDEHLQWNPVCDIAPESGDGAINASDVAGFADQWLLPSVHQADIAPVGNPDGKVDLLDFTVLTHHWMMGLD